MVEYADYKIIFYTTGNKQIPIDDPTYISHYDAIYKNMEKIQNNKPDMFRFENIRNPDGLYMIRIYKFESHYAESIIKSIGSSDLPTTVRPHMLDVLSDAKIILNR